MTMLQSGVELTITTFGTLLIAGAEAHDYSLVQEASPAWLAPSNHLQCCISVPLNHLQCFISVVFWRQVT